MTRIQDPKWTPGLVSQTEITGAFLMFCAALKCEVDPGRESAECKADAAVLKGFGEQLVLTEPRHPVSPEVSVFSFRVC